MRQCYKSWLFKKMFIIAGGKNRWRMKGGRGDRERSYSRSRSRSYSRERNGRSRRSYSRSYSHSRSPVNRTGKSSDSPRGEGSSIETQPTISSRPVIPQLLATLIPNTTHPPPPPHPPQTIKPQNININTQPPLPPTLSPPPPPPPPTTDKPTLPPMQQTFCHLPPLPRYSQPAPPLQPPFPPPVGLSSSSIQTISHSINILGCAPGPPPPLPRVNSMNLGGPYRHLGGGPNMNMASPPPIGGGGYQNALPTSTYYQPPPPPIHPINGIHH